MRDRFQFSSKVLQIESLPKKGFHWLHIIFYILEWKTSTAKEQVNMAVASSASMNTSRVWSSRIAG
jgi:hypothetical protein